jgi:hypothetical protein
MSLEPATLSIIVAVVQGTERPHTALASLLHQNDDALTIFVIDEYSTNHRAKVARV